MKTEYGPIRLEKKGAGWVCISNERQSNVGRVFLRETTGWLNPETIWMFEANGTIGFPSSVLLDIADFLKQLNEAKK